MAKLEALEKTKPAIDPSLGRTDGRLNLSASFAYSSRDSIARQSLSVESGQ